MHTTPKGRWQQRHDDRGFTLIEALVAVALVVVVGAIGASVHHYMAKGNSSSESRSDAWLSLQDANTNLLRDTRESQNIRVADAQQYTLSLIRDEVCHVIDYVIEDQTLTRTTTFYEQTECRGPSQDRVDVLAEHFSAESTFSYFGKSNINKAFPTPVDWTRDIARVRWDLAVTAEGWEAPLELMSSAAYTGRGETTGTGEQSSKPLSAALRVTTTVEGKDLPTLAWDDFTPAVTSSWSIYRVALPEGTDRSTEAIGQWQQVDSVPGNVHTWSESSLSGDKRLPDGYRATYVVRAMTVDAQIGPASNQVVTGMRPVAPLNPAAKGQPTAVELAWQHSIGATAWDIYRTNVSTGAFELYKEGVPATKSGTTWTWVDEVGYGQSHSYKIVATSQWEQKAKAKGAARLFSAEVGAFTAPAMPTVSVVANVDWSNTLTRTFAGWSGKGPTANRDRGWIAQHKTTTGSYVWLWDRAEQTVASKAATYTEGVVGGQKRTYQIAACNVSGCSQGSEVKTVLQRPKTPTSCTVSGQTTRKATVTGAYPAAEGGYTSYDLVGGTKAAGAASVTGLGTKTSTSWSVDGLKHATSHTFTTKSKNSSTANGGWSPTKTCAGTTVTLANPKIAFSGVTTRAFSATLSAGNGGTFTAAISRSGTAKTGETLGNKSGAGAHKWGSLVDGTTYTVKATNSDGVNTVAASATQKTPALNTPAIGTYDTRTTRKIQLPITTNQSGVSVTGVSVKRASGSPISGETRGAPSAASGTKYAWDPLVHNTSYTVSAKATDGFNTTAAVTRAASTTNLPAPTVSTSAAGTNRFTANASASDTATVALKNGSSCAASSGYAKGPRTFTGLTHNTSHTACGRNSDGFNNVYGNSSIRTLTLTAPSCTTTASKGTDPGTITITATGSNGSSRQVKLGANGAAYVANRTYSSLSAGTYTGYARSTDGNNYSGWVNCGARTISAPPPPAPTWSTTVPSKCVGLNQGRSMDIFYSAANGRAFYNPIESGYQFQYMFISENDTSVTCNVRIQADTYPERDASPYVQGIYSYFKNGSGGGNVGV